MTELLKQLLTDKSKRSQAAVTKVAYKLPAGESW